MTYTFARIKVHPKCDLIGWYLTIPASAIDLTMDMHKSAAISMFQRFFLNPHVFDQKTLLPKYDGGEAYHPVKLAAGWIQTALKGLAAHGVIYMNTAHGLLFGENVEIVETRESETLEFPVDDKDGITIVISMWGAGTHYYLNASNNHVFSQPKFDTFDAALAEARRHAFDQNISFKIADRQYQREGDQ